MVFVSVEQCLPSEFPLYVLQDNVFFYLLGLLEKSIVEVNSLPRREEVKREAAALGWWCLLLYFT